MDLRIGFGYDLHQLTKGRKLILGGVDIPCEKGLLGHSDADVVLHAITDALLGSLALGDIGTHFPDTDPEWKGADSAQILGQVTRMITDRGFSVQNADVTIIAESPKLNPFIDQMRNRIAPLLEIGVDRVSVKATTNERQDAVGRSEAIAAHAVILVKSG